LRFHEKRRRAVGPGNEPVRLPGIAVHGSDCRIATLTVEKAAGGFKQFLALFAIFCRKMTDDTYFLLPIEIRFPPDAAVSPLCKKTDIRRIIPESGCLGTFNKCLNIQYGNGHRYIIFNMPASWLQDQYITRSSRLIVSVNLSLFGPFFHLFLPLQDSEAFHFKWDSFLSY
jgi:hypothetical protein